MTELLLREVIVEGRTVDVRASDGTIVSVGPRLEPRPGEVVIDGRRGALVPGCTTTTSICWPWPPPSSPFSWARRSDAAALAGALAAADRSLAPGAWLRRRLPRSRSPGRSTAGDWTRSSAIGPYGCSTARASSGSSTPGASS